MNIDIGVVISILDKINGMSGHRNRMAHNFELFHRNKNLLFKKIFILNSLLILFNIAFFLQNIDNDYFKKIFSDSIIINIIGIFIRIFGLVLFFTMILKIFDFKYYFKSLPKKDVKMIRSKENKKAFIETRRAYFKFKKYRLKCYIIEVIVPVVVIIMSILQLRIFELENFIRAIIFILFTTLFVANHYDKNHSILFRLDKTYDSAPLEKLVNTEYLNILNKDIFINEEEDYLILYDNLYLEFKQKNCLFHNEYYKLINEYIIENLNMLIELEKLDTAQKNNENIKMMQQEYQDKIRYLNDIIY